MEFCEFFKNFDVKKVEEKIEEDGTLKIIISAEPKQQKKEIELIDINRKSPKRKSLPKAIPDDDVTETLEKNRERLDLSKKMLKSAFGEDFDVSVGTPKVVR